MTRGQTRTIDFVCLTLQLPDKCYFSQHLQRRLQTSADNRWRSIESQTTTQMLYLVLQIVRPLSLVLKVDPRDQRKRSRMSPNGREPAPGPGVNASRVFSATPREQQCEAQVSGSLRRGGG